MANSYIQGFDLLSDEIDWSREEFKRATGLSVEGNYSTWFPVSTYSTNYGTDGYSAGINFSSLVGDIKGKALTIRRPDIADTFMDQVNLLMYRDVTPARAASASAFIEMNRPEVSVPLIAFRQSTDGITSDFLSLWVTPLGALFLSSTNPTSTGVVSPTPTQIPDAVSDENAVSFVNGFHLYIEVDCTLSYNIVRVSVDGQKVFEELLLPDANLLPDLADMDRIVFFNMSLASYAAHSFMLIDDIVLKTSDSAYDIYSMGFYSVQSLAPEFSMYELEISDDFVFGGVGLGSLRTKDYDEAVQLAGQGNTNRYMLTRLPSMFGPVDTVQVDGIVSIEDADPVSFTVEHSEGQTSVGNLLVGYGFFARRIEPEDYGQWGSFDGAVLGIEETDNA